MRRFVVAAVAVLSLAGPTAFGQTYLRSSWLTADTGDGAAISGFREHAAAPAAAPTWQNYHPATPQPVRPQPIYGQPKPLQPTPIQPAPGQPMPAPPIDPQPFDGTLNRLPSTTAPTGQCGCGQCGSQPQAYHQHDPQQFITYEYFPDPAAHGRRKSAQSPSESRLRTMLASAECNGRAFGACELTFVRYLQEGGVTDVVGSPAEFDLEFAPRLEFGYVGSGGLGFRGRYWYFDAAAPSVAGDSVAVDTFQIDFEVFQHWAPTCNTELEIAAGMRYLDFEQVATNLGVATLVFGNFDGLGGTLAVEGKRKCSIGALYARGRLSLLDGDVSILNDVDGTVIPFFASGNTVSQFELGLGVEIERRLGDRILAGARFGYEWQQWTNLAPADTSFGGIGNDDVLEDVGFSGLVLVLGVAI